MSAGPILCTLHWHPMIEPGREESVASAASICDVSKEPGQSVIQSPANQRESYQALATAFVVLFCIVGVALWGLPFYYDFMVQQFGWTRAQVTSGNALSKLIVGPIFGFLAGWVVDRFGPRRLMMIGILMAGVALVGLGSISSLGMFYFFYFFNALGYVCGGPLPNQVLLTQRFDRSRGKAMGFAYLGIGIGGATVPWISHMLAQHFGWQTALQILGITIVVVALPLAWLVKEMPRAITTNGSVNVLSPKAAFKQLSFYLLTLGSMCSVAAISGTQQNLKLLLSLDRHFTQRDAASVLSMVLAFSIAGRLLMGWLADRFLKETRHAPDVPSRCRGHSSVVPWDFAPGPLCLRCDFWNRSWWRLHDHSFNNGGNLWYRNPGKIAGCNPDRRRYCGSCCALVNRPSYETPREAIARVALSWWQSHCSAQFPSWVYQAGGAQHERRSNPSPRES